MSRSQTMRMGWDLFVGQIVISFCIKVTDMSSINESGENEFAFEESNIVGISENSPDEKDKKILKSIKKEISQKKRIRKNNTLHFF
jgi:hypothetical protein